MYSAAERLGLKTVRISYVDSVDQYLQLEVVRDRPPTIFFDSLDASLAELKEQGHFVSPRVVLDFVNREGGASILDSRKPLDKMMVELWASAIYTQSLNGDIEYYVSVPQDDPPDAEILLFDSATRAFSMQRVEVTQHGRHSSDLTEVITKKLRKRYQDGTVLLVLVEQAQFLPVANLYEFIGKNNPHGQKISIIGGAGDAGKFKIVPWDRITTPAPDEMAWMEVIVDTTDRTKSRYRYDGVVFKPPFARTHRPVHPVFVKSISLHR